MQLKKLKSVTNGTRHQIILQKNTLAKNNRIFRKNTSYFHSNSGRSTKTGNITIWHKGGKVKKLYRHLSYSSSSKNSVLLTVMYDPYRNCLISLNFDLNRKVFFQTMLTKDTFPGTFLKESNRLNELRLGFRASIKNIPTGTSISNITGFNTEKTKYARSAGTSSQIIQQMQNQKTKIRLPSNKIVEITSNAFCSIGVVSNQKHNLCYKGKAGKNRHRGIRPTVRGIAMNPVDHPHGGRTNGGRPSVTPWGLPTKGKFYLKK
jgi:large subunit ribosomal protein L2